MRTLLVLGVLSVFVLLVTPSNGEGPQDGGGEKEVYGLKEFIGQNEDGRADWMEEASSLSIDRQILPRSRRQEPGRKKKKCTGCFSALSVKEKSSRIRRDEKTEKKKTCPGCYTPLVVKGTTSRIRRDRKDSRRRGRKRNGGKKRRLEEAGEGTRRGHRDDHRHPEGAEEEKIKRRFGTHSLLSSSRPGGTTEDLTDPKAEGLSGASLFSDSTLGGKDSYSRQAKPRRDMEERKRRGHHCRHPHRHHHHHPEGEKDDSPRSEGITEDLTDGKEPAEKRKRHSDDQNKKKERKIKPRVGSRSPIASLPS